MVLYCTMCKIWKLYVLDIFRLGPSHSGHSKSAPASWAMPADIEKKGIANFQVDVECWVQSDFSDGFLKLNFTGSEPKFQLLNTVWWCYLHCNFGAHWTKIWKDTAYPMCPSQQNSPCLLQLQIFMHLFCILNQIYFFNNCNFSLNNEEYY